MGRENNRDTVGGYILDSIGNNWVVRLENNTTIHFAKLQWNRDENKYQYNNSEVVNRRRITTYWPIRLIIYFDGRFNFTLNQLLLDNDTNNLLDF